MTVIFRIAANYNPPYVTQVSSNCSSSTCFSGMYADVWEALRETMNFTYTLSPPPDGAWGNLLENGSWNGMIGRAFNRRTLQPNEAFGG